MAKVEIARSRADMYRFLASVFLVPPGAEVVALLHEGWIADALQGFLTEEAKALWRDAIEATPSVEDLGQEFHNLFVVPMGQYTTPFEAVFRDEREVAGKKVRGLLMGPSTAAVIESYKRTGAKVEAKELPDHVGCELGFMEYLCRQETKAIREGKEGDALFFREEQRRFLEDHLMQWMPSLVEKINGKARLVWYRALSAAALGYLEHDLSELTGGELQ